MLQIKKIVVLAVCAVICASQPVEQPVEKLPILKTLPSSEIGIRTPDREITIECVTVDKDKNVKYSWLKDGKSYTPHANVVQLENEGTLVFKKPDRSDEGQYQCLAQTEYGVARTRVVTLKKYFMDPPNYTLKKHTPIEGKPYKLDCAIPKSYPQPDIFWFKESLTNPIDFKVAIVDQYLMISDQGDLYFSNVTKEDAKPGYKYVCYGKAPDSGEILELSEHILEDVLPNKKAYNDLIEKNLKVQFEKSIEAGNLSFVVCIHSGDFLVDPEWLDDGEDVNNGPNDHVMLDNKRSAIEGVWVSDDGKYVCGLRIEEDDPQMDLHGVSAPKFIKVGPK